MKKLEELFSQLGLDKNNGLFITKEELWKKDIAFPNRVKRLIERKIKPDAFFCFDNKPMILFFNNREDKKEIHKAIWNFNECPIAIFVDNITVEVFNGFNYLKEVELLQKLGGVDKLTHFTYFELVTGKTWDQYHEKLNYKNRVDFHLLQNIRAARKILVEENSLNAKIANSILGKVIFIRYLIDRGVRMRVDGTLRQWTNQQFCDLLTEPYEVRLFFDYIENKETGFNGDLFPLNDVEYKQIRKKDYQVLKDLLEGVELEKNQPSLFEFYDFSIIPIEFISNVYELFIGKDNQKKEGAYYTPLFLVDYILKETVEKKLNQKDSDYNCKVLDPACGSGIFLVETLRKIIEKYISETGIEIKSPKFKKAIKDLALENIYGIDKDLSAVQVAIFSIYLTLLDYLEPAAIEDAFKFPNLLNTNFFEADFFDKNLPYNKALENIEFDFILGNPPWNRGKGEKEKPLYIKYIEERRREEKKKDKPQIEIGNKEIAQAFLLRSSDFSKNKTKAALIVTSKVLYNLQGSSFRTYFLNEFFIERVFELAPVRREVFDKSNDKATAPACVLFFNYANGANTNNNLIEHIALKPSRFFSLFKIFTINRTDFKTIQQNKLKEFDWLWKVLVYGSYLDFNFLLRLNNEYDSINKFLIKKDALVKQGIKRKDGSKKIDVSELIGWDFLDLNKKEIKQFFIAPKHQKWVIENVGYIYRENNRICKDVFSPPVLLVKETVNTNLESVSAIATKKILFTDKVTSIKFRKSNDTDDYYLLSALMNSSLFAYYVLNKSSTAGIMIEQQINDEEKFGFPFAASKQIIAIAKEIEQLKNEVLLSSSNDDAKAVELKNKESRINSIVPDVFHLDDKEKTLLRYSTEVMIPIAMRHQSFEQLFQPINFKATTLQSYAEIFIERFKSKLNVKDKKFIVEIWHTNQIVGMFFKMVHTKEYSEPIKWISKQSNAEFITFLFKLGQEKITDRLFVQKDIRGFDNNGNDFYIIKPNEKRLWHKAISYLDVNEFADAILKSVNKRK
jgi:hypothetical protein